MQEHPAAAWAKSTWDPVYAKIIYHADAYSLQTAPSEKIGKPPKPPPGCGVVATSDALPPEANGDAGDAAAPHDDSSSGRYAQLLHLWACKHAQLIMKEALQENPSAYFSVPFVPASIRLLRDLLLPALSLGAPDLSMGDKSVIHFTVPQRNPSDAKQLTPESLTSYDIGVTVHQEVAHSQGSATLCTQPLCVAGKATGVAGLPLVLSIAPGILPMASLVDAVWWTETESTTGIHIGHMELPKNLEHLHRLHQSLFESLLGIRGSVDVLLAGHESDKYAALIDHYKLAGIVNDEIDGFDTPWRLTDFGRSLANPTVKLNNPKPLLQVRSELALSNMTTFELMKSLEFAGFTCQVYCQAQVRDLKDISYAAGRPKVCIFPSTLPGFVTSLPHPTHSHTPLTLQS